MGKPGIRAGNFRKYVIPNCNPVIMKNNEDFVGSLLNLGTDQGVVIHTGISGNKRLSARRS
jgi:hypothetical protein